MRRPVVTAAIALVLVAAGAAAQTPTGVLPRGAAAAFDTVNQCVTCHNSEREALTVGVHSEHGMRCIECHGGDPRSRQLPAAHRAPFIGKPGKVGTAQLCGSCHSDPNRMRQFGLPTGQLAEYRTSKHGQLVLGQGNHDAPTCTDCHGTHIIYRPDDARSNVFPTNIPGTCAKCHADPQLMAKYRLPTTQFFQFRASAHGVALFQHQNFAAPTCVGCHGAHSALPPTVTEIGNVCGRCHVLVDQAFNRGPHGPAAARGRLPACLGCHTNHGTERVAPDSIVIKCDKCHADNSSAHRMALEIQKTVAQATLDLQSAQRSIGRLQLAGRRASDYQLRYQTALTYYLQIAQAQHALDVTQLEDLARHVRSISVDLDAAAESNAEQHWERELVLLPVWFLALSAVALAVLTWRTLKGGGPGK